MQQEHHAGRSPKADAAREFHFFVAWVVCDERGVVSLG
jgi:hypothetical protein